MPRDIIHPMVNTIEAKLENNAFQRGSYDEHIDTNGRYTFRHAYHFLKNIIRQKGYEQLYNCVQWMYNPF